MPEITQAEHTLHLADMPFELISRGEKTIEVRLNDEKRQKIRVGDTLIFISDTGKSLHAQVKKLQIFDSFRALFSSPLLRLCGFSDISPEAATDYMYSFYSPDAEARYGVLSIEFVLIK